MGRGAALDMSYVGCHALDVHGIHGVGENCYGGKRQMQAMYDL